MPPLALPLTFEEGDNCWPSLTFELCFSQQSTAQGSVTKALNVLKSGRKEYRLNEWPTGLAASMKV